MKHYEKICKIVDGGDVSAEVIATDFDGIIEEGKRLADIAPNIVVKVPMIKEGVKALRYFYDEDIRTNCTLVFSAGQAILAAKAGATYLSPFIGRIDDINWEGMDLIRQIAELYAIQGFETEILAASIRSSKHIVEAALSGADVVTCPLSAITGLLKHPLTDIGLEKFLADHKKANELVFK
jgi:transaldolase